MASNISILTDLQTFTPVYNRMEICVNETDAPTKALTDYQYIFDVYIESVTSPAYKRFQVPKDPVLGYGAVDISRFCESHVMNTMSQYNSTSAFSLGSNATVGQSIIKVTVKYGYSYSNAGVYTVVADTVVGSAKYAFNGSFDPQFFYHQITLSNFDANYLMNVTNGANGQFLTDMKTNYVSLANLGWHHVLTDVPTDLDSLVIETYDSAGALIATNIKANIASQALTVSRMYKIATGPQSINQMTGAWISGGPNPVITSDVASYDVYIVNGAGTVVSETLHFIIQEPCRYTQRRVHFLNRFGSFDSFNFDLRSQRSREIERKGFKLDPYPIVTAGISRSFTEQAQVTSYVATQDKIKLQSDFITTDQNTWLRQLIESPEVYLEELDGAGDYNLTTVESVTGTSWLEKETSIDKLFTMEVELKFSQKSYRQRR